MFQPLQRGGGEVLHCHREVRGGGEGRFYIVIGRWGGGVYIVIGRGGGGGGSQYFRTRDSPIL